MICDLYSEVWDSCEERKLVPCTLYTELGEWHAVSIS